MGVLNKSLLFFAIAIATLSANSQYPVIPLNTPQRPPGDLLDASGKKLDIQVVQQLQAQGKDSSRFEPVNDKYWSQPVPGIPGVDAKAEALKQSVLKAGGLEFVEWSGGNREMGLTSMMVKVKGTTASYGLTLGTEVHTSLVRAALLRKLGYYQNSPTYFKEVKVTFASKERKEDFISKAFCGQDDEVNPTCIQIDPFKNKDNPRPNPFLIHDGDTGLIIRTAYLEKLENSIPSLIDGITPASEGQIERFGINRTFRSLAATFAISDLSESLNRVEPESVKLRDGSVEVRVKFGSDFRNADHYDLRWILRKIAALDLKTWKEIIDAGQYPHECLKPMAYNGLIGRMRNMIDTLNINPGSQMKENPNIQMLGEVVDKIDYRYNCGGIVVNGNLTKEFIGDSPIRFSHGLRDSPWGKGDTNRALLIQAQSGAFKSALDFVSTKISEQISILEAKKNIEGKVVMTASGADLQAKMSERKGFVKLDGGRTISTGTIMGSQAPVQLVDNITLGVGYKSTKVADLTGDVLRGLSLGVIAQREFTYVQPIKSMQQARDKKILDVLKTPFKLKELAEPLETGNIRGFLQKMEENEVFFITDTISLEGTFGFNYGLGSLKMLGISVMPSFYIGTQGRFAVVGQTMFMRTANGMHIVVRKMDPETNREISGGFTISLTALVEIFGVGWEKTKARYLSDVYNITYDPEFLSTVCPKVFALMPEYKDDPKYSDVVCESGQRDLEAMPDSATKQEIIELTHKMKRLEQPVITALSNLIFDSNSEYLRTNKVLQDERTRIKNDVGLEQMVSNQLAWRQIEYTENQKVMLWEPKSYASKTNGQPIVIGLSSKAKLEGLDTVGFMLNGIDAYAREKLGKYTPSLAVGVLNPAGMLKGSAHWKIAETQSEITSHGAEDGTKMPSLATVKYVWGGWSLKQADLDEIIAKVNQRVPSYVLDKVPLIPPGVFDRVGKIDFYQLMVTFKIEPQGLENIKRLIFTPDMPDQSSTPEQKRNWLSRILNKLNQKLTGKYRAQDKVIFDNIIALYGKENYQQECMQEGTNVEAPTPIIGKTYAGTDYSCLSNWVEKLIEVSRKFSTTDTMQANEAMTEALYILDQKLPLQALLDVVGFENYRYGANVYGFRAKDENAVDADYVGPMFGEPPTEDHYQNMLVGELSRRLNVSPLVINRKMAAF